MLAAFNITLRKCRARNCARKIWMPLTITCLRLYTPNANIYTGLFFQFPNFFSISLNYFPLFPSFSLFHFLSLFLLSSGILLYDAYKLLKLFSCITEPNTSTTQSQAISGKNTRPKNLKVLIFNSTYYKINIINYIKGSNNIEKERKKILSITLYSPLHPQMLYFDYYSDF